MREADAIAELALKKREKTKVDEEKRAKEAAAKAERVSHSFILSIIFCLFIPSSFEWMEI